MRGSSQLHYIRIYFDGLLRFFIRFLDIEVVQHIKTFYPEHRKVSHGTGNDVQVFFYIFYFPDFYHAEEICPKVYDIG